MRTHENTPLATSSRPTKQEIFDVVVRHAALMPCKSMRQVGTDPAAQCCAYRGAQNNSCFLCGLLTDAEAAPLDDRCNSSFSSIREEAPHLIPDRFKDFELRHFLTGLQRIHDSEDQADWAAELRDFAVRNRLSALVLDEVYPATTSQEAA